MTILVDLTNVPKTKLLSHSSISTLNSCPRKYEIYKLNLMAKEPSTVDTAFGHALGAGIQSLLVTGGDMELAKCVAFANWEVDITWSNDKAKKSFYHVCLALEVFLANQLPVILDEWEVLYINGRPASELGFCIEMPNQYFYRGFIDIVLVHRTHRTTKVIELKTTKFNNVDPAMYRNSFQGVGYGVILDAIASELNLDSDFYVDYIVYQTGSMQFTTLPFLKTFYQRAKWLDQLQLVMKTIDLYESTGSNFPMNGDSCFNFFKPCPYFGQCEQPNESLAVVDPLSNVSDTDFADLFLGKNTEIDNHELLCDNTQTETKLIETYDYLLSFDYLVANQLIQMQKFMEAGGIIPTTDVSITPELEITFE